MPSFRDKKSFGERIEYQVTARMLMEGMDCYKPLIDDHGVDLVIKQKSGQYIEVQIKARSKDVQAKNSAFFAAIDHELSPNYFFIF